MRTFLWLITLAMAVMCFVLWVLAGIETGLLKAASMQLPAMTEALVLHSNWLLLCPGPWILASLVLSFRKEVSHTAGFVFLGTVVLASSLILFPVLLATALPWLGLFGHSISK